MNTEPFNNAAWTRFANRVFSVKPRQLEALFVHGASDSQTEILAFVAELFKKSGAEKIFLNGLPEYEVGQDGFVEWQKILHDRYDVPLAAVRAIEPSQHTLAEAQTFINVVEQEQLHQVAIIATPRHIIRAILTHIGLINQRGIDVKVYPFTLPEVNWNERIVIHSPISEAEETTRLARLFGEFARIVDYRQRQQKGDQKFIIADVNEGNTYFDQLGL